MTDTERPQSGFQRATPGGREDGLQGMGAVERKPAESGIAHLDEELDGLRQDSAREI